jgi:hypothetical protein
MDHALLDPQLPPHALQAFFNLTDSVSVFALQDTGPTDPIKSVNFVLKTAPSVQVSPHAPHANPHSFSDLEPVHQPRQTTYSKPAALDSTSTPSKTYVINADLHAPLAPVPLIA